MSAKMTKMQACGALCGLQEKISQERDRAIKWLEKEEPLKNPEEEEWRKGHRIKEIAQYDRWLRAIEMAGVALTR